MHPEERDIEAHHVNAADENETHREHEHAQQEI